jgi:dolichol-phosphate mannosyltransferase
MLERLRADAADVVVGTRYAGGGGFGDLSGTRVGLSRLATRVARRTLRAETSDPMSGFFMVRRDAFMEAVRDLSGIGFKILLDLLASSPRPLKVAEEPYSFRARQAGESKLDTMALWEFGMLLLDKTVGRFVPVRFIAFALIGGVGVGIHMAILATLLAVSALAFAAAHTVATVATMCANFALNNAITYRDRRLKGSAFVRGLLGFVAICSVGALANVGIAAVLFDRFETTWWASALAGILAGAVWNFAVSSIYTWRPRPPRPAPAPVLRPDPARSL